MTASRNQLADTAVTPAFGPFAPAVEYMVDAAQRSILFWDVMRERGNQYREHLAQAAPHVLSYAAELVIDGRTLDRPVNYALVRIVAPSGVEVDPTRRPFVIVDPRAGHGPGIGGFKGGVGTAVFGGMIAASCLGIFLIPVLYVAVQWAREKVKGTPAAPATAAAGGLHH